MFHITQNEEMSSHDFCHTNLFFEFWHRWIWIVDINNVDSFAIISSSPLSRHTRRIMSRGKYENSASAVGQLKHCRSSCSCCIESGAGKSDLRGSQCRHSFFQSFEAPVRCVVIGQHTTINFACLQNHLYSHDNAISPIHCHGNTLQYSLCLTCCCAETC